MGTLLFPQGTTVVVGVVITITVTTSISFALLVDNTMQI